MSHGHRSLSSNNEWMQRSDYVCLDETWQRAKKFGMVSMVRRVEGYGLLTSSDHDALQLLKCRVIVKFILGLKCLKSCLLWWSMAAALSFNSVKPDMYYFKAFY